MFSSTRTTRRSARRSFARRNINRDLLDFAAAIGLAAFTFGGLAFGLFLEMAVHVAQGNKLHIGADAFFAAYSSAQLAYISIDAGFVALAGMLCAGLCAIAAKNI